MLISVVFAYTVHRKIIFFRSESVVHLWCSRNHPTPLTLNSRCHGNENRLGTFGPSVESVMEASLHGSSK